MFDCAQWHKAFKRAASLPRGAEKKALSAALLKMAIGIGPLEKGVRNWVRQLERRGFTLDDIDVFRTGPGGNQYYGPSYVEVTLAHPYMEDGEEDTAYFEVKFTAGGYGALNERDIGGTDGWRAMKAEAERRLQKEMRMYDLSA